MSVDLMEAAIDSLAHLIAGVDGRKDTVLPKAVVAAYDGFELIDHTDESEERPILLAAAPNDIPIWPMDARWACTGTGAGPGWVFGRVATLNLKSWRGRLRYTSPRMYELSETYIPPNGEAISSTEPFAVIGGKLVPALVANHHCAHPIDIYSRASAGSTDIDYRTLVVSVGHGIELRREYNWSVLLGEPGIPRARFMTDPVGIRAVFRLRDIPAGRQRRTALRHWVREHWRQNRNLSKADRDFVRNYMRGATEFHWNGLDCAVDPSREDRRRNHEQL